MLLDIHNWTKLDEMGILGAMKKMRLAALGNDPRTHIYVSRAMACIKRGVRRL